MQTGAADVQHALARVLRAHPIPVVLDAEVLPRLLAAELPQAGAADELVRAVLLAPRTRSLHELLATPPASTPTVLAGQLQDAGVPGPVADDAAGAWAGAIANLRMAERQPSPAVTLVDQPLVPPVAPPPVPPPVAHAPGSPTRPQAAPVHAGRGGRTPGAPVLVLAVVALAAIVAAVLGWSRDPSKGRAEGAEAQVGELAASLDRTRTSLGTAEATLAQRTAELAAEKEQVTRLSTLTRAQFAGAPLPQRFALTGRVAPGSCTLTGEACNVTTTVRNIALSCTGPTCDCTNGSCTVTSDLWKTAVPVAYDAATGLYTSKGNLDADLFRCGGVPQPTSFEFRFRVTRLAWSGTAWLAGGIEAELAQASSATDCLAGNRTYALSGPAA